MSSGPSPTTCKRSRRRRSQRSSRRAASAARLAGRADRPGAASSARARAAGRRLDAELLRRARRGIAIGRERVGLAAGAVEGEHQLSPQALSQRVAARSPSSSGRAAPCSPRARSASMRSSRHPRRSSSRCATLAAGERLVELGQRRPAPERERLTEAARRPELLEALQVRRAVDRVAGSAGLQRPLREDLAQLRDGDVDHLHRGRRLLLAPEVLQQRVDRDDPPRLQEQAREQRTLPWAAERDRRAVVASLQRPEDEELRARRATLSKAQGA